MTTTNDSLKLAELLKTPICKMDGEELAFLISSITSNQQAQALLTQKPKEEHNVYGIAGIAQIFGYSPAFRLSSQLNIESCPSQNNLPHSGNEVMTG